MPALYVPAIKKKKINFKVYILYMNYLLISLSVEIVLLKLLIES
jgi:hypothetical protein